MHLVLLKKDSGFTRSFLSAIMIFYRAEKYICRSLVASLATSNLFGIRLLKRNTVNYLYKGVGGLILPVGY